MLKRNRPTEALWTSYKKPKTLQHNSTQLHFTQLLNIGRKDNNLSRFYSHSTMPFGDHMVQAHHFLERCNGNPETLQALLKYCKQDYKELDAFLEKIEEGRLKYRINQEGQVVVSVTKKGIQASKKQDEEALNYSAY